MGGAAHLQDLHELLVGHEATERLKVRQRQGHLRLVVVILVHLRGWLDGERQRSCC